MCAVVRSSLHGARVRRHMPTYRGFLPNRRRRPPPPPHTPRRAVSAGQAWGARRPVPVALRHRAGPGHAAEWGGAGRGVLLPATGAATWEVPQLGRGGWEGTVGREDAALHGRVCACVGLLLRHALRVSFCGPRFFCTLHNAHPAAPWPPPQAAVYARGSAAADSQPLEQLNSALRWLSISLVKVRPRVHPLSRLTLHLLCAGLPGQRRAGSGRGRCGARGGCSAAVHDGLAQRTMVQSSSMRHTRPRTRAAPIRRPDRQRCQQRVGERKVRAAGERGTACAWCCAVQSRAGRAERSVAGGCRAVGEGRASQMGQYSEGPRVGCLRPLPAVHSPGKSLCTAHVVCAAPPPPPPRTSPASPPCSRALPRRCAAPLTRWLHR